MDLSKIDIDTDQHCNRYELPQRTKWPQRVNFCRNEIWKAVWIWGTSGLFSYLRFGMKQAYHMSSANIRKGPRTVIQSTF